MHGILKEETFSSTLLRLMALKKSGGQELLKKKSEMKVSQSIGPGGAIQMKKMRSQQMLVKEILIHLNSKT